MPSDPIAPLVRANGLVIDPSTGLLIPRNYRSHNYRGLIDGETGQMFGTNAIDGRGFARGHVLNRDPDTLIVRWPEKGSGYDDFVNESIVDGTIANVGIAPVVAPQISAMVKRQQLQAATATIALSGREYPAMQARNAIAMFNDSPMGATAALKRVAYAISTYNRGCPIATVPIIYDMTKWSDYGLEAVPLNAPQEGRQRRPRQTELFYLRVDWLKHGTPVPFLPSVYDLEPSGIADWPYWYRSQTLDHVAHWVLLHKTHILEFTGAVSGKESVGTSPVWMCLGVLAEEILVLEGRAEKAAYGLTDGITLLGGVEGESGDDILATIEDSRKETMARGFIATKGQTILTSPMAEKVSIAQVSFRQNEVEFEKFRQYVEDVIVFAFGETLTAMVMRGGVGYGAQAATGAENSAESGVSAILYLLSMALGAIYPRVQVSISRPNDRAQRLNIGTLVDFAGASKQMIDAGVMTPAETRAIIDRDILDIPVLKADTVTVTPNSDDPTVSGTLSPAPEAQPPNDQTQPAPAPAAKVMPVKKMPPKTAADIQQAYLHALEWTQDDAPREQLGTLFKDGQVSINDGDAERAVMLAGTRVSDELAGLLVADKE